MKISVFGIGYIGTVVAGCMADEGHEIVAVDISADKVDAINAGQSPIVEPGLLELIERAVKAKRLSATTDVAKAIEASELSFICVGTPSLPNGNLDLKFVLQIAADIGKALKHKSDHHMVVVRSTILPGVMENSVIPVLRDHSGKEPGKDFGLGYYPEFLRESSAIEDFRNPATRLPLQHKTYNKEAKIGYSDSVRSALQRVFYVDTDLYLTEYAPKFHADRRGDLAGRQFDRLEHRHPGPDSADNQIECIGEDLQKTPLVSVLGQADQDGWNAKRCRTRRCNC